MNCSIEIANIHDVNALVELEESSFDTDKISQQQFRYLISKSSALVIIAKLKDNIVGSAVVLFRKNSSKARLYSIAVHLDYRRQGIAQILYEDIENRLLMRPYSAIYLEVKQTNYQAIQFYLKNGYQIENELKKYYEDRSDGFRMRKIFLYNMQLE